MDQNLKKRVINLNPYDVRDETLATLKDEIREQASIRIDDIESVTTVVLDANDDSLDSHATIFTEVDDNE